MQYRCIIQGLVCVLTFGSAGCTGPRVFSPPARFSLSDTASVPEAGEIMVAGEFIAQEEMFGGPLFGGALRARGRWTEHLEWNGALSLMHSADADLAGVHPNIYAARAGVKLRLARYLAVSGGLGGGGSAAGVFVSPDVAAVLAFENHYFVPIIAGGMSASLPIIRNEISARLENRTETLFVKPSFFPSLAIGFRVPFGDAPLSATTAVQVTGPFDEDKDTAYVGLSLGLEATF